MILYKKIDYYKINKRNKKNKNYKLAENKK
jgi:hypothetical protein